MLGYSAMSETRKTSRRATPAPAPAPQRRSPCPLNASVEMLGDRWSLLILRDMMLRGARTYSDLLQCQERIATNILADRLRKLEQSNIIASTPDAADRRKSIYRLTQKGIDLAPVMAELVLWAARHERTGNQLLVRRLKRQKQQMIDEVRRAWRAAQMSGT
jgi:DNA-binding HxlR family transcriptional regulator